MPGRVLLKPSHKAIKQYYQCLQGYRDQGVKHEGALETAFGRLLADTAKLHHCTLIPKQKFKIGKQTIFPDGTVREVLYDTRRGFWEAKDTDDDLNKAIADKKAKGYPLGNIIFENTRRRKSSISCAPASRKCSFALTPLEFGSFRRCSNS